MTQDLPKTIPDAIVEAAREVMKESQTRFIEAKIAQRDYDAQRRHVLDGNWHLHPELLKMGHAIVEWGSMVRDALPARTLCERFRTRKGDTPSLTIINHEIVLGPLNDIGFPGGRLTTTLLLELDPDGGLFRHWDRFVGHRVSGSSLLNTGASLCATLHPKMLGEVYAIIAEGQAWKRIDYALKELLKDFKDR